MCDVDDAETCDFYDQNTVEARKPHKCSACGEKIAIGVRYRTIFWKFEGEVGRAKQCARCAALHDAVTSRGHVADVNLDCGVSWDEAFEDDPPPEVEALAFALPTDTDVLERLSRR